MLVRAARPDEAEALTSLCRRSKAAWGYDAAFMRASEASLTVRPTSIAAGHVFVAEADGVVLGVGSIVAGEGEAELDLLFVDPGAMRSGVGRALLMRSIDAARTAGAARLVIIADPNAAGFYERCGARYVGDVPSDAILGRTLPMYVIAL